MKTLKDYSSEIDKALIDLKIGNYPELRTRLNLNLYRSTSNSKWGDTGEEFTNNVTDLPRFIVNTLKGIIKQLPDFATNNAIDIINKAESNEEYFSLIIHYYKSMIGNAKFSNTYDQLLETIRSKFPVLPTRKQYLNRGTYILTREINSRYNISLVEIEGTTYVGHCVGARLLCEPEQEKPKNKSKGFVDVETLFKELNEDIIEFKSMRSSVHKGYLVAKRIFKAGLGLLNHPDYDISLFPQYKSTYDLFKSLGMHMGLICFYTKHREGIDIVNPLKYPPGRVSMLLDNIRDPQARVDYVRFLGDNSPKARAGLFYKFNPGILKLPVESAIVETAKLSFKLRIELLDKLIASYEKRNRFSNN